MRCPPVETEGGDSPEASFLRVMDVDGCHRCHPTFPWIAEHVGTMPHLRCSNHYGGVTSEVARTMMDCRALWAQIGELIKICACSKLVVVSDFTMAIALSHWRWALVPVPAFLCNSVAVV